MGGCVRTGVAYSNGSSPFFLHHAAEDVLDQEDRKMIVKVSDKPANGKG